MKPPSPVHSPSASHPRAGWTAMEIILTVAIIILLLGLALPAFLKTRPQRQKALCLANLDDIASACRHYAIDRGGFPASLDELVPTYLPEVPRCPADGDYALGTPEGLPPSCPIHAPPAPDLPFFPTAAEPQP